jgi:hypothetical protein
MTAAAPMRVRMGGSASTVPLAAMISRSPLALSGIATLGGGVSAQNGRDGVNRPAWNDVSGGSADPPRGRAGMRLVGQVDSHRVERRLDGTRKADTCKGEGANQKRDREDESTDHREPRSQAPRSVRPRHEPSVGWAGVLLSKTPAFGDHSGEVALGDLIRGAQQELGLDRLANQRKLVDVAPVAVRSAVAAHQRPELWCPHSCLPSHLLR